MNNTARRHQNTAPTSDQPDAGSTRYGESELAGGPPGSGRVEGKGDIREARETHGRRRVMRQITQPGNRQNRAHGLAGLSGLAGFSGGIRVVAAIVRGTLRRIHHGRLLHRAMRRGQDKVRISLKGNRNGQQQEEECPEPTHVLTVARAVLPRKQRAPRHGQATNHGKPCGRLHPSNKKQGLRAPV